MVPPGMRRERGEGDCAHFTGIYRPRDAPKVTEPDDRCQPLAAEPAALPTQPALGVRPSPSRAAGVGGCRDSADPAAGAGGVTTATTTSLGGTMGWGGGGAPGRAVPVGAWGEAEPEADGNV